MAVNVLSLISSPLDWLGPFVVDWYWRFQLVSLLLLVGTVLFGLLTIIAGREANKRQAIQIFEGQRALEAERFNRVKLAKLLARRSLPLVQMDDKQNIDPLRRFQGMRAIIEYLPEREPKRAAADIQMILGAAHWLVVSNTPNEALDSVVSDGVAIESYSAFMPPSLLPKGAKFTFPTDEQKQSEQVSNDAGNTLAKFLISNNWGGVKSGLAMPSREPLQPNTIRVRVGFKPEPQVLSPVLEEFGQRFGFSPLEDPNAPLPQQREQQRRFSVSQREKARKMLQAAQRSPFDGPRLPIEIKCPAENIEACNFASEIADLLGSAGWPIQGEQPERDKNFPRTLAGLFLEYSNAGPHFDAVSLRDAFKAVGIETRQDMDRLGTSFDPLVIWVGW